jgi:hypothetical protein
VQFATSDFYRIEEGKVVEHWDVVDRLPRAVALGLVPAPGPKLDIAQARLRRERPHETVDNLIRITFEAIVVSVADPAELAVLRPR